MLLLNDLITEGIIARWISIVDMYDFEIEDRMENLHLNADGLFRIPVKRKCTRPKYPDCDSPEHLANSHNLNLDVVAEEENFPHEILSILIIYIFKEKIGLECPTMENFGVNHKIIREIQVTCLEKIHFSLHQPTKPLARIAIDIWVVYLKRIMEMNMLSLLVIIFQN